MSILLPEEPLIFLPGLAKAIGLNEAIVLQRLQQLLYYTKDRWVAKSYEEWQEEFPFWSIVTISRIFTSLETSGYIKSKQEAAMARTKSYTVAEDIDL